MQSTPPVTLVLGASEKPERYSNKAVKRLQAHGHSIMAVGAKSGNIGATRIEKQLPDQLNIDTVTLYLNPKRQAEYEEILLQLKPRRIIFNPGTENYSFAREAENQGIEVIEACTLVLLSIGEY